MEEGKEEWKGGEERRKGWMKGKEEKEDDEKKKERENSCKSDRWSAVPVPCLSSFGLKLKGSRAVAQKGSMTYAFK